MKSFIIILALILIGGMTGISDALDLTPDLRVDGYAKIGYALEDTDARKIDNDTGRLTVDVNTNYMYDLEAGITVKDLIRVYGLLEGMENILSTYGFGAEVTIPKVHTGVFVEYNWSKDLLIEDGNKLVWAGVVLRLP